MDPILFTIGPFQVYWYGILMAAAFFAGYFILRRLAKEDGIKKELIDTYFFYIFLGIIIGARLGEIVFYEPGYYFSNPIKMLFVWEGGLSSHGAFIGGIIATLLFCWIHKVRFYKIADIAVIPIAFGSIFIRIGNFINQEIVGRVTNVPWAMKFENYDSQWRHPSQIYEAIMNFAVFAALLGIRRLKKLPEGFVFWSFVLIYSFLRFFVEFFKEYQTLDSSGIFTMGQWLSLAFFVIAAYFMATKYRKFLGNIYKKPSKKR